ncbi:Periplasmic pH-dependent serine endoprotease DegQ [Ephemeroptericola cinctiostellae]|uniref:Periplasmic pH-dependent serine endoprotease DegQ n=1 Tax=Ephemeroptericola cinctiostellae TaxID=2268024 RepID=A0A345D8U7_9BURK|nr:trypsin-like peptidase domain-containing protein [Ephemeroptericola cinctiostellae]AXF84785.1 Periplasmic pH-dependent serine endoprotease DegQ [Ephemeroptericola cinctiostellae]
MLKRFWLGLAQVVTVLVLAAFVVLTLKPQWLPESVTRWMSGEKAAAPVLKSGESLAPREAPRNVAGLSYHDAVATALPSVVKIFTSRASTKNPYNDPTLNQLYNQGQPPQSSDSSLGSGVIIDPQGFIVTNHHVIAGADQIEVALSDGRRAAATVVGSDADSDVAVLKINLDKLPSIVLGHDDQLQVGDVVLAIGNPFGVGQSVTMGIVSALHRNQLGINTFENFIQTDAAINPGNSGGALVDSNGNLIGINTAIVTGNTSGEGANAGIGFAIPVSIMKQIADELIATGTVTRGYIGVSSQNVTPEMAKTFNLPSQDGVIIASVRPEGPAGQAGISVGDILTQVNDSTIKDTANMLAEIARLKPGSQARVKILRNGQNMDLTVIIAKRPISKT